MTAKILRCAVYTRKSTEEGLDQAFNSLHAQREACEAYVLSQAGEGWITLPVIYDDGGFSGGNMDRPALKALLGDIDAGKVDIVVVYKVDRLTRSLGDFGRIVERFDKAGASFVSVTQAFNTTTSMGRLTLNVLLSFAQFEREVTGERIRDKIAQSKAKGMWMGGRPPLGYDPPTDKATRALVVNPGEAETVRLIYQRYLEIGSVHRLMDWLRDQGIRSKAMITVRGKAVGGVVIGRGQLFQILQNRTYQGCILHKDRVYPGSHPAIVDELLFQSVQAALAANRVSRKDKLARAGASPFKSLIFDADGIPMSPAFGQGKSGQRYRYYVSASLQQGVTATHNADETIRRVSAGRLETFVGQRLAAIAPGFDTTAAAVQSGFVQRLEILPANIVMTLRQAHLPRWASDPHAALAAARSKLALDERLWVDPCEPELVKLSVEVCARWSAGRTAMLSADGCTTLERRRRDRSLIKALRGAHVRAAQLAVGADDAGAIRNKHERNLVRLAYLAPDIQRAIFDGRQPADLTLQRLVTMDLPVGWPEQRQALGF